MSRAGSALAVLIAATVIPGCGAPTTLTRVADDLQATLISMPGVTDAWVYHDEGYAEGVVFNIAVDVATATRAEIVAVADRIAATRIDLVANYTQNVEFWVASDKPVTLRRQSHVDAAQIADDAERLRAIAAGSDGRIDWLRGDDAAVNTLAVDDTHTPGTDLLDVVRRTAGDTGVTMSVSPSSASRQTPRMVVSFPLSAQREASVVQFLDTVPVDVFGLRIDTDGVRALTATVPADTTAAERQLTTTIDASRAVAARPMELAWYVPSALGGVPVFGGVVEVGDCSAASAEIRHASLRTNRDDRATLQARLQAKADTCPTPEPIHTKSTPSPPVTQTPAPPSTLDRRRTSARTPDVTSVATRPTPTPTGSPPSGAPPVRPVRLPSPVRPPRPIPIPAAALDPSGPRSAGAPGHTPPTEHRTTSRTARSSR